MVNHSNLSEELKEICKQFLNVLEKQDATSDSRCLRQIQGAIQDRDKDDFEVIDDIVEILNEFGWNTGARHDFG